MLQRNGKKHRIVIMSLSTSKMHSYRVFGGVIKTYHLFGGFKIILNKNIENLNITCASAPIQCRLDFYSM